MNATRFIDTNVLVYAYDLDEPDKRVVALKLVEEGWSNLGGIALSVQVLQELFVNLVRKGQSPSVAGQIVRDFSAWPIVDNTFALLESALKDQARWKISIWDALILAAARFSGARDLITEDLNHGQEYDGVVAFNPFH